MKEQLEQLSASSSYAPARRTRGRTSGRATSSSAGPSAEPSAPPRATPSGRGPVHIEDIATEPTGKVELEKELGIIRGERKKI